MVTPSLQDFLRTAKEGKYTPLRRRIPADLETPVSVFLKLKSGGATFLLESVERGIQMGRYSFIGISPVATIQLRGGTIAVERGTQRTEFALGDRDPLSVLRDELARSPVLLSDDIPPGPIGGAVGYLSYDLARYFESLPEPERNPLGLPDYSFLVPSAVVIFDHVKSEIEIVSLPEGDDAEAAFGAASDRLHGIYQALMSPLEISNGAAPPSGPRETEASNVTEDHFKDIVAGAKEYILSGDAFQIVLSQRLQGKTTTTPFQIYRALRILNPSPYMFFVDFGEFQLIGSSPEVLVKLDKRAATLCPIAGTRPRGASAAEDDALEEELVTNEKERAEHVMLVDLGRNDLGRVCEMGSVATEALMHVEKYSHVMHLVSRITGTLKPGLDGFDLVRASFPAGTLTGAPKIRAMEIISELEGEKRGPYGGAVGYFSPQGDVDLCITIRTIVMAGDRYYVQGGAGIVADSDPGAEYQETLNKVQALRKAVLVAEKGL
ncbi:MAG: anthranilate synthase component I [Candidatus Krumholzibacteriia bacterium]